MSQYDADGNRTRVTHPDGARFDSVYDAADRLQYTNPTAAGGGAPWRMLTMAYDPLGRRTTMNPASSDIYYQYDPVSRLQMETQHFAGSVGDGQDTLTYNPASQITSEARTNDAFVYGGAASVTTPYQVNGLNQYTAAGPASLTYDADGNLSSDGATTYGYDAENRLISASGAHTASLAYDPLGRLWSTTGAQAGSTTLFLHDGDEIALEMNGQGALLRRYMWGPGVDEPIVWDEGGALSCGAPGQGATTRVLHADHEGSVVAYADCWGNQISVNSYDEHGIPSAANAGRFGYTGQAWIPELGLWYYKARLYSPTLGRFMQTDPVGYKDQVNLYEYVGDDPVDRTDPSGNSWLDDAASFAGSVLSNPDTYRGAAEVLGGGLMSAAGAGGVGGSGAAEGASFGLATPVALPAAAISAGAVVTGAAISVDGGKTLNAVFSKAASGPGSYTNTHESGRTYSGKGSRERSQVSGQRVEKATGDKHVATDWKASGSQKEAFKDEAQRIKENGGAKSSANYNKIESLGKKYLDQN